VNVINAGIHKLEMEQQVDPGKLKALEDLAGQSEQMEEGLAALEQLDEEAESLMATGSTGVSDRVQSVLDELRAKAAPAVSGAAHSDPAAATPESASRATSESVSRAAPSSGAPTNVQPDAVVHRRPDQPVRERRQAPPEVG
jgi:hypothetical protein